MMFLKSVSVSCRPSHSSGRPSYGFPRNTRNKLPKTNDVDPCFCRNAYALLMFSPQLSNTINQCDLFSYRLSPSFFRLLNPQSQFICKRSCKIRSRKQRVLIVFHLSQFCQEFTTIF